MMRRRRSIAVGLSFVVAGVNLVGITATADVDEKYKLHFQELWKCAETLGLVEQQIVTVEAGSRKYTYESAGDSGYGVAGRICERAKGARVKESQSDGYGQDLEDCSLNMTENQLDPLRKEINSRLKALVGQKPDVIKKKISGCRDIEAVKTGYAEAQASAEKSEKPAQGPAAPAGARVK